MRYIYKNITKSLQLLTLASPLRNSVSQVPLGANATIELSYPGLDLYLPHILARLDEGSNNITHVVLREQAEAKVLAATKPAVLPKPIPVPEPSMVTNVQPAIYVDKTKEIVKEVPKVEVITETPAVEIIATETIKPAKKADKEIK